MEMWGVSNDPYLIRLQTASNEKCKRNIHMQTHFINQHSSNFETLHVPICEIPSKVYGEQIP